MTSYPEDAPRPPVGGAPATFFTITDSRFAPATMAMCNSLRLVGHAEPMVILDVGLARHQRATLEPEATLVPFDRSLAVNPTLFKAFARLVKPRGVVAIIDSDQIVTGSLAEILGLAADGAICAFPDPEAERWFESWATVFELKAPLRREPYVNAGFIAFSVARWPSLLDRWWDLCKGIWHEPTLYERRQDGPTAQGDQDALNALLMSEVPAGSVLLLDPARAPAADGLASGVEVVDAHTLRCRYRGIETAMLHSAGKRKPWIARDWAYLRRNAYVRLLRRLLTGNDVALRPASGDLPIWLRPGPIGATSMLLITGVTSLAWRLGNLRLIRPLAARVRRSMG